MAFIDLSGVDSDDEEPLEILSYPQSVSVPTPVSAPIQHAASAPNPHAQLPQLSNLDAFLASQQTDPLYQAHLVRAQQDAEKRAHELRGMGQWQQWQRLQLMEQQQQEEAAQPLPRRVLPACLGGNSHSAPNIQFAPPPPRDLGPAAAYVPLAQLAFSLVSLREFTVRASVGRLDDLLLQTLRETEGYRLDEAKKRVVFPLSAHQQLVSALTACFRNLVIEPLPAAIIAAAVMRMEKETRQTDAQVAKKDAEIDDKLRRVYDLPSQVIESLAPFQREAVHFVCDPTTNDGRALVADEMGLGKTRTAIGCICAYKEEWPVLIVVPSSARHQWRSELLALTQGVLGTDGEPYLPPQAVTLIEGSSHPVGSSERHREYKVVIISYNLVDVMHDSLRCMPFGVVVLDECHYLKSSKAKRTKVRMPVAWCTKDIDFLCRMFMCGRRVPGNC